MSETKTAQNEPRWSVMIDAEPLGETLKSKVLEADQEAMALVQKTLDVDGLANLKADLSFEKINGYVVHVTGTVSADIRQSCVVTLEPIDSHVAEPIDAYFADPAEIVGFDKARKQKELETEDGEIPILDEKDDPEPLIDGKIDLGDLAVQFLSLGINPYPHKEGVTHEFTDEDHERIAKERMQDNPFAALKDWKEKQKDN